ncbi:MAG: hypothetical protein Kow006_05640 [Gammaproteobacteria bacterium]
MPNHPLLPDHEELRRAVAWLAEQGPVTPQLIEEACLRFDLSPADEEFMIRQLLHHEGIGDSGPSGNH